MSRTFRYYTLLLVPITEPLSDEQINPSALYTEGLDNEDMMCFLDHCPLRNIRQHTNKT